MLSVNASENEHATVIVVSVSGQSDVVVATFDRKFRPLQIFTAANPHELPVSAGDVVLVCQSLTPSIIKGASHA